MPGPMEHLFHNIAPFVREISLALAVVFAVSFAAGWLFARGPDDTEVRKD